MTAWVGGFFGTRSRRGAPAAPARTRLADAAGPVRQSEPARRAERVRGNPRPPDNRAATESACPVRGTTVIGASERTAPERSVDPQHEGSVRRLAQEGA